MICATVLDRRGVQPGANRHARPRWPSGTGGRWIRFLIGWCERVDAPRHRRWCAPREVGLLGGSVRVLRCFELFENFGSGPCQERQTESRSSISPRPGAPRQPGAGQARNGGCLGTLACESSLDQDQRIVDGRGASGTDGRSNTELKGAVQCEPLHLEDQQGTDQIPGKTRLLKVSRSLHACIQMQESDGARGARPSGPSETKSGGASPRLEMGQSKMHCCSPTPRSGQVRGP